MNTKIKETLRNFGIKTRLIEYNATEQAALDAVLREEIVARQNRKKAGSEAKTVPSGSQRQ